MNRRKKKKREANSARDINSKRIFSNATLYAQFLKDNVDLPFLKNVRPEDIEDVSERYQPYLGLEFEADTVKKIWLRDNEGHIVGIPLFLISLTEHKSAVDYNTAMQLLKYMVCIWTVYGKEMEEQDNGSTKRKGFRYPPILPIVYYEGKAEWTAAFHLRDRIWMGDIFGQLIPDFSYGLVRNHDYSNEELLSRGDEMSLIMMLNKIQSAEDFRKLMEASPNQIAGILERTQQNIKDIIKDTMFSLFMKMHVPLEEAKQYVELIEECRMGYLFENMEKIDIQAERRKTAKEHKKFLKEQKAAAEAHKEAVKAQEEAAKAKEAAAKAQEEAAKAQEEAVQAVLSVCKDCGMDKEAIIDKLMVTFKLTYEEAKKLVD